MNDNLLRKKLLTKYVSRKVETEKSIVLNRLRKWMETASHLKLYEELNAEAKKHYCQNLLIKSYNTWKNYVIACNKIQNVRIYFLSN